MFKKCLAEIGGFPIRTKSKRQRLLSRAAKANACSVRLIYTPRIAYNYRLLRNLPFLTTVSWSVRFGAPRERQHTHPMTEKLPSVVIVGRPNVGKSTIFNRLTGTRRSIVTDEPGITRDRIYGTAKWQGRTFEIVDTGGIVPDDKAAIPREILRQAQMAIENASQLLLVVDARAGLMPLDSELALLLRRTGKPLAILANKIDTQMQESLAAPFYVLSNEVYPVSAEHGYGIDELFEAITAPGRLNVPQETISEEAEPSLALADLEASQASQEESEPVNEAAKQINVAIIGRPNVGKSTMLNRLAGEERSIVSDIAGTTRDAVDTMVCLLYTSDAADE